VTGAPTANAQDSQAHPQAHPQAHLQAGLQAHAARAAELKRAIPQWLDAASGFKPEPARNPSLPTLVGLLMLILCFFVLLTSISLRDKSREETVMASLARAFSGQGIAQPSPQSEADQETRKLLGDLQAKVGAEVPLVTDVKPQSSDDYVLRLPRGLVFKEADGDKSAAIADGFDTILAQALAALKAAPNDFAYEVEAVVSAPALDDRAVARGAAVAKALRDAGFANDAAIVSLQAGSGDTVDLTIRLRPNARVEPASGGQP
jgi:hypothetical protein